MGSLRVADEWLAASYRQLASDWRPLLLIEIPKNAVFFLLQLFPAKNAVYFAHYG